MSSSTDSPPPPPLSSTHVRPHPRDFRRSTAARRGHGVESLSARGPGYVPPSSLDAEHVFVLEYTAPNLDTSQALKNVVEASGSCLYDAVDTVSQEARPYVFRFDQNPRYVSPATGGPDPSTLLADAFGGVAALDRTVTLTKERLDKIITESSILRRDNTALQDRVNHLESRLAALEDNLRTMRASVLLAQGEG